MLRAANNTKILYLDEHSILRFRDPLSDRRGDCRISALVWTLWAYNLDNRMVSDTVTAAIINTAAAMAAMGFFGGFDMVLSIWQFFRNQEAERARNRERETARAEREEMMAMLRAEHQRNQELHDRVMELSELAIQRANGGRYNGNTQNDRGE